jgi:hypothetical protein
VYHVPCLWRLLHSCTFFFLPSRGFGRSTGFRRWQADLCCSQAIRFLDEGFGVSLGWNYLREFELFPRGPPLAGSLPRVELISSFRPVQWTVTLPVELTAAGITVQYWTGGVPIAGWITM